MGKPYSSTTCFQGLIVQVSLALQVFMEDLEIITQIIGQQYEAATNTEEFKSTTEVYQEIEVHYPQDFEPKLVWEALTALNFSTKNVPGIGLRWMIRIKVE